MRWVFLAAVPSGPAGRGDRAYLDRRRRGAAAVGHPARALSPHLRDRVLAPADHSALAGGRGAAGLRPRRWSRSSSTSRSGTIVGVMAVHIVVFFVCTLMCHGELAQRRPPARYLTSFYMWMSFGGMIGGIARRPDRALRVQLDRRISDPDHAGGAVPARPRPGRRRPGSRSSCSARSCSRWSAWSCSGNSSRTSTSRPTTSMLGGLLILTVLFWRDPVPFAAIIATVLLAHHFVVEGNTTLTLRSFFGVHEGQRDVERPIPHALARHHAARRTAHPRQARAIRSPAGPSRRCTTTTAPPSRRAWTPPARSRAARSTTP